MNWLQRHRVRQYIQYSLWLLPVTGLLVGILSVRLLHRLESDLGWESGFSVDGARAVLGALAASMFTLVVFVASALLVVFQLVSSQMSPRIIAIVLRDPVMKWALTVFMFSFAVTIATLVRITGMVPLLTIQMTTFSCIASLALFLYLMDHVGKLLRPSGALRCVARAGREVIEEVYPRAHAGPPVEAPRPVDSAAFVGKAPGVITSSSDGVVLAFDLAGLAALACVADCTIELVPEVGDFVATGDPLFRVSPAGAVPAESLRRSVALGQERTVEQDPMFVFRILVDIAAKALSPAVNDPTTAVLAIDQIHHLLRSVGTRNLSEGVVRDGDGRGRLFYRTPDWEDFVQLAVTEIRQFGASSIQVVRRLQAMLDNLVRVLPAPRAGVLRHELGLLQKTADRSFPDPEDRALAGVGDAQGVGGGHAPRG